MYFFFSEEHIKRMIDEWKLDATGHPVCRCNKIIVHANAATPHFAL